MHGRLKECLRSAPLFCATLLCEGHMHFHVRYLVRKVQGGALSSLSALDSHQKRHGSVQQVVQMRGNNGQVDVLPLEGEEQGGGAL